MDYISKNPEHGAVGGTDMEYNETDWMQEEIESLSDTLQEAYENGKISMDEYAELVFNNLKMLNDDEFGDL